MQLGLDLAGKGKGLETHGRIKLDIAFAQADCIAFDRFHCSSLIRSQTSTSSQDRGVSQKSGGLSPNSL